MSTMSSPRTPTKSDEVDKEQKSLTPKWKKDAMLYAFNPTPDNNNQNRRIILDEDDFQSSFLKCMVCQEVFDRTTYIPKVLPCQHNVCLSCLLEMFRVECEFRIQMTTAFGKDGPRAVKITCPACRESCVKSDAEIRTLPNDVTLLELGEFICASERCVVSFCNRHPKVPMNFYCDSCQVQICSECTNSDHGCGHDIIGVDTAVRDTESDINATLDLAIRESGNISKTRHTIESVIDQLDSASESISQDIYTTFEQFGKMSNLRAEELITIMRSEIDKKREYLSEQLRLVSKREADLNASRALLQEARACEDFNQIFVHHKIIKKTLAEHVPLPVCGLDDVKELFASLHDDDVVSFVEVRDRFGNIVRDT